jgi:uncharacterized membrane protein YcaP (DUF421 family)
MPLLKIDWKRFLLGEEDWSFLAEVGFRTFFMFAVILIGLSILGKRGVKQLSVFELVVIIGLGSAAGDPMFYKDVGLLPALLVFILVIGLYIFVTHWVGRSKKIERLVEGKPVCLIEDGKFAIDNFSKEPLGQDEFFAELRINGVSHLGQVEKAIIETNGGISVFYYEDKDIKYGLPILPGSLDDRAKAIQQTGNYACVFCGYSEELSPVELYQCPECKKDEWVKASNKRRVS